MNEILHCSLHFLNKKRFSVNRMQKVSMRHEEFQNTTILKVQISSSSAVASVSPSVNAAVSVTSYWASRMT
jgi:hypothetical protein